MRCGFTLYSSKYPNQWQHCIRTFSFYLEFFMISKCALGSYIHIDKDILLYYYQELWNIHNIMKTLFIISFTLVFWDLFNGFKWIHIFYNFQKYIQCQWKSICTNLNRWSLSESSSAYDNFNSSYQHTSNFLFLERFRWIYVPNIFKTA